MQISSNNQWKWSNLWIKGVVVNKISIPSRKTSDAKPQQKSMKMIKSLVIQGGLAMQNNSKNQWKWSNLWWFRRVVNKVSIPNGIKAWFISKTSDAKPQQKPMKMIKSLVIQGGLVMQNNSKNQWKWSNLWWFRRVVIKVSIPNGMKTWFISKTSGAKPQQKSMKMIKSLVIQVGIVMQNNSKNHWKWPNLWWFRRVVIKVSIPNGIKTWFTSKSSGAKPQQKSMKMIKSLVIQVGIVMQNNSKNQWKWSNLWWFRRVVNKVSIPTWH